MFSKNNTIGPSSADKGLPHYFEFYRSRILATILVAVYTLAITVIVLLPLAVIFKLVISLMLACSLFYYLWRYAWLLSSSSKVAMRMEGGDIFLISLDGREEHVQISNDSLVTPVIAVLNVMPYGKRKKHSVVIFPDGIDPERFRELRVLLKWGGFEAPG